MPFCCRINRSPPASRTKYCSSCCTYMFLRELNTCTHALLFVLEVVWKERERGRQGGINGVYNLCTPECLLRVDSCLILHQHFSYCFKTSNQYDKSQSREFWLQIIKKDFLIVYCKENPLKIYQSPKHVLILMCGVTHRYTVFRIWASNINFRKRYCSVYIIYTCSKQTSWSTCTPLQGIECTWNPRRACLCYPL